VVEPELNGLLGGTVALYANRVAYPPEVTLENLAIAEVALEEAVRELVAIRPDVVVWACTSGSVHAGPAAHAALLERLGRWAPGARPVTAASAVTGALHALGAASVAVLTPYPPDVNARLTEVLVAAGFAVPAVTRLFAGPVDDWTLQAEGADRMLAQSAAADRPEADVLLVSCTGIAGAAHVAALERELGKPVLTSNIAIAHAIRSAVGHAHRPTGPGRLLGAVG
jgi:maleate cis-trans isomerase